MNNTALITGSWPSNRKARIKEKEIMARDYSGIVRFRREDNITYAGGYKNGKTDNSY